MIAGPHHGIGSDPNGNKPGSVMRVLASIAATVVDESGTPVAARATWCATGRGRLQRRPGLGPNTRT